MKKILTLRLFLVAPFVAAAACMMTPVQQREDTLNREARLLNDDLRWARYEQVAKAMPADEGPLFLSRANAIADELVMGDNDVESITFGSPSTTAIVVVKIDWYYKRDSIVKSTTLEQRWRLDDGRWSMFKQRRMRGDRFPLVTEPVTPPPVR